MGTPNTREFDEVLRSLCSPWREEFDRLEPGKKAMVSELRFLTGCPVSLTIRGDPWFMDQQGFLQGDGNVDSTHQFVRGHILIGSCESCIHRNTSYL